MEENLHPAHRARATMARLGRLIEEADPVERLIEDRERRDALRDVERRRLEGGLRRSRGWDDRRSLP